MSDDIYPMLSRVFTRAVLKSFATRRTSNDAYDQAVKFFISKPDENTIGDNFEIMYQILENEYRNEYYYKNTLINKLLLGVHSINTTTALTELPIAEAKADFVMINGKAVVYEIKTELDNLNRLDNQIQNYYKVFKHVCVLSYENNAEFLLKKFENVAVGVYIISSKGTIRRLKEPEENDESLTTEAMFDVLRKHEYESVILKNYGYLPQTSQFKYFETCKDLFQKIDEKHAYNEILAELKKRNPVSSDKFKQIPKSLKALSYFSELTSTQYDRLNLRLNY